MKPTLRRLVRRALLVVALPALLLGAARPCLACSCAISDPREQARGATSVFTGRAVDIRTAQEPSAFDDGQPPAQRPVFVVRFAVETAYQGDVGSQTEVRTEMDSAACGFGFQEGARYTVFTYQADGATWTGLCSGTTGGRINPSRYGLAEQPLGQTTPTTPATDTPTAARRDAPGTPWGWLAAFLVASGAVVLLPSVARRRRGHRSDAG